MERQELIGIYEETLSRLSGDRLVEEALRARAPGGPVRVMAIGKAAEAMWAGAERVLGPLSGIAVGPGANEAPAASRIEWLHGEHPVPGPGSLHAGERLLAFATSIQPHETALVLLSGGASALAEALPPSISLDDLAATTRALLASGVSIDAFNVVRKHLSLLKGGRLAAACRAGRIEVLTISDVFGDDPAVIGSGPFAPDPSTFAEALGVIRGLPIPPSVVRWLEDGVAGTIDETPKALEHVDTRILAGPLTLARTAAEVARERGFAAEASDVFLGTDVGEVASFHLHTLRSHRGPARLVAHAAEPTLKLPPNPGKGGRSQHLALLLAPYLEGSSFLAGGSDGQDGVGGAAGAAVDGQTAARARAKGLNLEEALRRADSGSACEALGVALPARSTGTNLADLHLLALPESC